MCSVLIRQRLYLIKHSKLHLSIIIEESQSGLLETTICEKTKILWKTTWTYLENNIASSVYYLTGNLD